MKRLYWGLGISLVFHLLLIGLVPGISPRKTDSQEPDSVEVRIHSASAEPTENPPPKPEPQNVTESEETDGRKEPTDPPEHSLPDRPEKTSNQTKEERSVASDNQSSPSEANGQTSLSSSTGNVEPTEQEGQQAAGEKQDQSTERSLLTRKQRFGDVSGSSEANQSDPSSKSSVLSAEPSSKYRVIEEHVNNEIEEIKLEPPKVIQKSPRPTVDKLNFTVESKSTHGQLTMEDWALPKTDTDAPVTTRKILQRPLPQVPEWLEREGEDVRVSVGYSIDENGRISTMEILKSSGYSELDSLVMETMQKWRWESGADASKNRIIVFRFQLRAGKK